MALTFETTHEYYLSDNVDIYYCEEHKALMISRDYEDRIIIKGIDKEVIERLIKHVSPKLPTQQRKTTKRKTQTKTNTTV